MIIRISGGRVRAVLDGPLPPDRQSQILDYSDCTIIPGLVDAHIHLAMSGETDPKIRKAQLSSGYEKAAPVMRKNVREMIRHGISGARDGGDACGHALLYKKQVLNKSSFDFEVAGKGWHARGRYGSFVGHAPEEGRLADTFKAGAHNGDHLKIINSGINSLKHFGRQAPPQFSASDLEQTVQAAVAKGLSVMVHANGRQPVKEAIAAGCTSIEHGYFMGSDNLERLAEKEVVWVPTVCPMAAVSAYLKACGQNDDVARRTMEHQLDQLRRARELGVVTATGTDAGSIGVLHGVSIAWELELFAEAGYRIEDAIACSSVNGQRLIKSDHTGLIEEGVGVDMAAVSGSPKELLSSLKKARLTPFRGHVKIGS